MKKIGVLLITLIFIFFLKIDIYKAIDCNSEEYACAVCTYSSEYYGTDISYTLVSNGSNIKVYRNKDNWTKKTGIFSSMNYSIGYDDMSNSTYFISTDSNNSEIIRCLDKIYMWSQDGSPSVSILKSNEKYSNAKVASLTNNINNNKKVYISNSLKSKSCTFNVYNQGTTGINILEGDFTTGSVAGRIGTVTITSNGARILSTVFSNSALSLDGKDYSSFAQKINNNEDCPEIFVLCNKNACSLLNYIPSELKNAEKIKKDGNYSLSISDYDEASRVPTVNVPNHNCTSLLGDPTDKDTPSPAFLLSYAFKVLRYVAIILLVVLSIMDFVSSVSSQDTDSLKKAVNKTIRRAILCVIIFLLPYIIEYVLSFLNDNATKICINT